MAIKKLKGTKDYYGLEAQQLNTVKDVLRDISQLYGFKQVYMPVFEETSLFLRSVGESSDIVNKEMYTFEDKKNRSLTLRPEGTAQAARMVLENKLVELGQEQKIFYIENMYRYERPQKGRQREFIQFGLEWFGNNNIESDVQTIQIATDILNSLEIKKYRLNINSIGSIKTRKIYKDKLKEYFLQFKKELSPNSKERFETNVLRILDSKDKKDIEISRNAPSILDFLNEKEKENFESIKSTLKALGIKYVVNDKLVRGLDYYNDLVFEFVSTDVKRLGAQSTILGGGRYNGLLKQLDERKDIPAIGFAIGLERLMLAAEEYVEEIFELATDYAVVTVGKENLIKAMQVATILRNKGNIVSINTSTQKLARKLDKAERSNSRYVVIVGNNEEITVKEFSTGEQWELKISEI